MPPRRSMEATARRLAGSSKTAAFAAAAALTLAVPGRADVVDDFVRAEMVRQRIPGLTLVVVQQGRTTRVSPYGLADVEHRVPVLPETVFQSGSVGKQFTAAAVLLLAEEGKLALDDPLSRHFEKAPEAWAGVTVRQLLSHTSGIREYENGVQVDFRKDYTEDELVQVAMGMPFDFPPGTQWSYSNTGYIVLGALVRKASGQFYGDVLRERIFGPLGMATARVISEAEIVPNRARGYRLDGDALRNQDWVAPSLNTTADGSLYLSGLDLARWLEGIAAGRPLAPASFRASFTPVRLADGSSFPYGFGWFVGEQRGRLNLEHGGAWQGFKTHVARFPEQRLGIAVLANLAQADPARIAHGVAGRLRDELALPDLANAREDPDPARTTRLAAVLEAWARAQTAPGMAAGLAAAATGSPREAALRRRSAKLVESRGAFRYLAEDEVDRRGIERFGVPIARILYYAVEGPEEEGLARFYLGADGTVADVVLAQP